MASPSLIHIGLPKTATTALQKHFFPRLGLTYVPYTEGDWYKLIRYAPDYTPAALGYTAVTSGENLCTQGAVGSNAIAERLFKMFGKAVVLMVVRNPVDHFASWYRQMIISSMTRFAERRDADKGAPRQLGSLMTIDEYFDANWDLVLRASSPVAGTLTNSYFATMDLDRNLEAFRTHFDVMVVDYDMIARDFPVFTKRVCERIGIPPIDAHLPKEKISGMDTLESRLAILPQDLFLPDLRKVLTERYAHPKLSGDRMNFLSAFIAARCSRTFAEAAGK